MITTAAHHYYHQYNLLYLQKLVNWIWECFLISFSSETFFSHSIKMFKGNTHFMAQLWWYMDKTWYQNTILLQLHQVCNSFQQSYSDEMSKMCLKMVNIIEFHLRFHWHIWNHNKKCIEIIKNMPSIGLFLRLLMRVKNLEKKNHFKYMVN